MKIAALLCGIGISLVGHNERANAGAIKVSAGWSSTCAITGSGALYCWGAGYNGTNGDGTTSNRQVPTAVSSMSSGVTDVSVGANFACAVKSGGLYCWGTNSYGLGDGSTTVSTTPVAVSGMSSGVSRVAVGQYFACAIQSGNLYCWGDNSYGDLGLGTSGGSYSTPQAVSLGSGVTAQTVSISPDSFHACATGTYSTSQFAWCWGSNSYGQLGLGDTTDRHSPTYVPIAISGTLSGTVRNISVGCTHTCAIADNYTLCWGSNVNGELGDGNSPTNQTSPEQVFVTSVGPLSPYYDFADHLTNHSTAITRNSAPNAVADSWGDNSYGRLGNNSTTASSTYVRIHYPGWNVANYVTPDISSASVGGYHSCMIYYGKPYCWGWNFFGQTGTNDAGTDHHEPTPVAGSVSW